MRCCYCGKDGLRRETPQCPHCKQLVVNLLPPDTLLREGRYRIEQRLGKGGFGITYRATDLRFERTVAIKEFFPYGAHRDTTTNTLIGATDAEADRKDFLREGRNLAKVKHPNIPPVYDDFEENDTAYLVMEFIEGKSLRETMPLTEVQVQRVMEDLVSALAAAHSREVYHLDIKPANVLIEDTGRAVLVDFGSARQKTNFDTGSGVSYTLFYAPVELITRQFCGPFTDIFEMGMMLHEMLTGELPPDAQTRFLSPEKRLWKPTLSEPWQTLVTEAIQIEPERRPRDIQVWWSKADIAKPVPVAAPPTQEPVRPEPATVRQTPPESKTADSKPSLPPTRPESPLPIRGKPEERKRSIPLPYLALGIGGLSLAGILLALNIPSFMNPKTPNRGTPSPSPRAVSSPSPPAVQSIPSARVRTRTNKKDGAMMVWIPAGEFLRGSKDGGTPSSDKEVFDDEKPQRKVYLSGYWMYRYPVTVKQFKKFTQAKPYTFDWQGEKPAWGWQDDHPMVNVTWVDAKAYCDWAQVALPTEAQWEKAARGTDGRTYPWGNAFDDAKLWAAISDLSNAKRTASVYRSTNVFESPSGCVDMAGNVWQWCSDWYKENYYKSAPSRDPLGANSGRYRVLRGGSWDYNATRDFRSASRGWDGPTERYIDRGFRASSGLP